MKKLLPLLCLVPAALARADWPGDAGLDVPVANIDSSGYPSAVPDNQGGIFVIFAHSDATESVTLRGEHFSAEGERLWSTATPDGSYLGLDLLGLSLGTAASAKAMAITDTDGGFIAAYTPGGNGPWTLDFQRFNATPTPEWSATGLFGGVELLANPDYYSDFYIVPDALGGALTMYLGTAGAVGQRVDSTGTADYGSAGYLFGAQYPGPFYPTSFLSPDGQGGMYFIWTASGSAAADPDLTYVTPTGAEGFQVAAVSPQTTPFEQWAIAGLPDGGGVWAAWWGNAGLASSAVVLQQFLPDAGTLFDAGAQNGFQFAPLPTTNTDPGITLLGDGTGGVTAVWYAVSAGIGALYAQHVAADGGALWGANPVLVSSAESTPVEPDGYLSTFRAISGPGGNPTLVWIGSSVGVYAEQLDLATGAKLWGALSGGIEVSTVDRPAYMDVAFGTDQSAYVAYQDSSNHVYVKRIEADGTLGGAVPDAGPSLDAGVDAGMDAGTEIDAGADAGMDAGTEIDAGVDAGMDAGTEIDAGVDAGETADAGPIPDAGITPTPDAGPDAGTAGDGGAQLTGSSGCSCSSGASGGPWSLALLLLGALKLRRRSSRQRLQPEKRAMNPKRGRLESDWARLTYAAVHACLASLALFGVACTGDSLSPQLQPGEVEQGQPALEGFPCGLSGGVGSQPAITQCAAPLACIVGAIGWRFQPLSDAGGLCESPCTTTTDCSDSSTSCDNGFCATNFCVSDVFGQPVSNGTAYGASCVPGGTCVKLDGITIGVGGTTSVTFGVCTR